MTPQNAIKQIEKRCCHFLKALVRGYQLALSPLIPPHCRFYPSCSCYCHEALEEHGAVKGLQLSFSRIMKCHPGNPGGYDPVPSKRSSHHG